MPPSINEDTSPEREKWKHSRMHFLVYLNGLNWKKGNILNSECFYVSVLKEQIKIYKVFQSISSWKHYIAIELDFIPRKTSTWWWGKVRKFQSTSIKTILQRSRKGCVWQLHPDDLMQAWQFYALLVKVRLAHWWCAYYQSQQQSVQNYLIMLKTQSSAPLSPEPSSLNTAYAESRAISAAALGQAWAPSALIKCMAAKLWQAIN